MWIDNFIASGFVDTFREINKLPEQYSWWSYRTNARQRNLGWRIDYIYATANLRSFIKHAQIHSDACHSDHCPISLELDISCL